MVVVVMMVGDRCSGNLVIRVVRVGGGPAHQVCAATPLYAGPGTGAEGERGHHAHALSQRI